MILEFSCTIYENFRLRRAYNLVFWQLCMMKIDTNIMDWSYQTWKIWQILFDWGIWLPAIPVVSIGFYFVTFGFHQWGLILFEIITIFFWKITPNSKKVGTKQGTQLAEAKALRSPSHLNFPAAVISYCKTKKIKWLIFLLMWWNPLYGCCA